MDEVDLLKALGEVCSDATAIIESMHALRKKIRTLHADAEGDLRSRPSWRPCGSRKPALKAVFGRRSPAVP